MAGSLQLLVVGAAAVLALRGACALPTQGISEFEARDYLAQYGYAASNPTDNEIGAVVALEPLSGSIAEFQRFAGLRVTGELDADTIAQMRQPRCGVKDVQGPNHRARRSLKRFAQHGTWKNKDLKYKIMSWPTILRDNKQGVADTIREAFQAWQGVSGLTFEEVAPESKANIGIRFASWEHDDLKPFDGVGKVLAHAFFPKFGGEAHFDDSERWNVDPRRPEGVDLFWVAAHEFGHSLGLLHSKDSKAVMSPFYTKPSIDRDIIQEDDIRGIQALYGPPGGPEQDPILCTDSAPDAMLTAVVDGVKRTYAFKNQYYWRLTATGIDKGYPLLIRDEWDGAPNNLDAVLPDEESDRIYFFKGSQYWRMTGSKMDDGYPKAISHGFPGIPDNLDAAFKWSANGKIYFFKGSQYWRLESDVGGTGIPRVSTEHDYPLPIIEEWKGIPNYIDTAFTYENGQTYFFKDSLYWRFDNAANSVDSQYPLSTGKEWFGCGAQRFNPAVIRCADPPVSDGSGDDEPDPRLCSFTAPEAMLTVTVDGVKRTYAFKNQYYWRLTATGVDKGYPLLIHDEWDGAPNNLDAVLPDDESDRIYFFKGSQYWRMTGSKMDDGYPKAISHGFPGIPDNLDAAFKWGANGKMYLFKGSQYWRLESDVGGTGIPRVSTEHDYPLPITEWRGIPDNIDTAFTYENGLTYFFKDSFYWRFDNAASAADSSYPLSTGEHWFGCGADWLNIGSSPSHCDDPPVYDVGGDADQL